jgi:hypothetical protein
MGLFDNNPNPSIFRPTDPIPSILKTSGQAAGNTLKKAVSPGGVAQKTARQLQPEYFGPDTGKAGGLTYSVSMHRYPEKTGAEPDLPHYMVFFINVREKSQYKGDASKRVAIKSVGTSLSGKDVADTAVKVVTGGAGAVGAASLANLLLRNFGKTSVGGKAIQLGGVGVAFGLGAYVGAELGQLVNESLGLFTPDRSFRISDAIMLAINEKPSVKYGVDYDGKDLGTLIGALSTGSFSDQLQGERRNDLTRILALQAAKLPQGIANILGADFALSDALQFGSGLAPNPFREQVFRNVENRTFRFDYKFYPRSESEAQAVRNIIKKFKFHMHPEVSSGKLFYVYPSTFDIAYYYQGYENTNLHRISTCVLERMSVDYGGQTWNTFGDGMPTEINLSLEFRELERLTKERIDKEGF